MTPLTTVIVGPRCRLTEVPPARVSNAATSRSAPLRLLTSSRPTTSTGRCVSPGAVALAATGTGFGGLAPPLLDFGICCSVWPGLTTTFGLAELSAGTSRTAAGGCWAPTAAGGVVVGADCAGRNEAGGGSDGDPDRVAGSVEATSGGAGRGGLSRV